MARRALTWLTTGALAATGFAAAYALASPSASPRSEVTSPRPRSARAPLPDHPGATPPIAPRDIAADRLAARAAGTELYIQLNEEHPEDGPMTWAAIDHAVSRAVEDHVASAGPPATACAPDGSMDGSVLVVRWAVSSRADGVHVRGGHLVDTPLPDGTRRCLEKYLGEVVASSPPHDRLIELDILYQVPILAGTAR